MTSAAVVEQLSRGVAGHRDLPSPGEAEERLLRHMYVGATLLPAQAERYRALRRRWEAEGTSAALRADALEAAGDAAAVLQGGRRDRALALRLRRRGPARTRRIYGRRY